MNFYNKFSNWSNAEKKVISTVIQLISILLIIPSLMSIIIYVVLLNQPQDFWQRLMPQAIFSQPKLSSNIIILTRKNTMTVWDFSSQSHYTFPNGRQTWIALKEDIIIPKEGQSGGLGGLIAVDKKGNFFTAYFLNSKLIWLKVDEKNSTQIKNSLINSIILVEDNKLLDEMRTRIPQLIGRFDVISFNNAFIRPLGFSNSLPLRMIPRITAFIGYLVSGLLVIFLMTYKNYRYNWVLYLLGLSFLVSFIIPLTVISGTFSRWFLNSYNYILWVIFSITSFLLIKANKINLSNHLENTIKYQKKKLTNNKLPLIMLILFSTIITYRYLSSTLTTGDSARYVLGAMYIFDKGSWPLKEISHFVGSESILANYPPGISAILNESMWMAGTDKKEMFFPGIQTGSILIIYAFILVTIQLSFLLSLIIIAKSFLRPYKGLWPIAVIITILIIPSLRGDFHAGETVLWPIFGNILIALLYWKYSKLIGYLLIAILLSGIMLLVKPESVMILSTLVLSWLIWCIPKLKSKPYSKYKLVFPLLIFSYVPYFSWIIEKRSLNIHMGLYNPFSFKVLLSSFYQLINVLKLTLSFAIRSGSIIPLGALLLIYIHIQHRNFRWRHLLIPLGVIIYFTLILTTYVFANYSNYPSVKTVIIVSWNRLLISPLILLYLFIIVTLPILFKDTVNKK